MTTIPWPTLQLRLTLAFGFLLVFIPCLNGITIEGRNSIDECLSSSHNCHTNARCMNTWASFLCACNSGYSGDGLSCSDINECLARVHDCGSHTQCTNTVGSFLCPCTLR
eukprot:TRINITY_DN2889_c0_g1::TRINITY_DN2889_c0_g1_i24::g.5745::m.5745 TRINITY_DN2889_c0_g1::TRINITY_DN2889_c0_g1_i24::g.5745  ORF type:complete len:110 (+),score=-5.69,sp/P01132/EGF_MOUSE/43.68/9e-16,sp/P01132/EGF_MOUSE/36.71/4e-07,EGF_CA/PF07645.10/3.5e-09,EGF_CA/PF07645.10/1.2e-08,EGF_3/PF12947.2/1.2e-11,EGF_3/PF12947.2/0.00035,cEGF/PF12662.2/4.5e-07,EGF/PF00008.22/1.2e+03,EGF/PF00008.22/6.8e-06,EGF/PF00008.22/17,EGF_MSP1_1/PF12946.2/0.0041,EGF_MSP1_1/PF12946.2/14,FXa_inhibition/PF14670.1/0.62,FXa_in